MVKYKNIRVKMKGGKSRLQRVKVLASGKYRFVKNVGRKLTRRSRRKSNPSRKRGGRRMARRYRRYRGRRRRGGSNTTAKLYKLLRLGALAAPAIFHATYPGHPNGSARFSAAMSDYTGYDMRAGDWHARRLIKGWGAYFGACAATYGLPKLWNLIRKL